MVVCLLCLIGHFFGKRSCGGDFLFFFFILACVEFNTFDEAVLKFFTV